VIYDYLVSKSLEEADIFHGWNRHCFLSLKRAKELGAITVLQQINSHPLTQYKLLSDEYRKYGKEWVPDPSMYWHLKELKECDYVLIPSEFVKASFIENGWEEEKLILVLYGVDLNKFRPSDKRRGPFRAIFVGFVQLRKGIQYLLEAWESSNLPEAELLVVGRIMEDCKDIVKKYPCNNSIKFLGRTPNIPYQKADVFVLPSIEEGSAKVTYEAMACGLPSIVTYNTGSVVRDEVDGFVIPIRDVKALADKIRYFYDNTQEVKRMGKNARKRAEAFSWENYERRLVKAYSQLE
jgi:glycosyltransferase involved in cell wall biosynthesis